MIDNKTDVRLRDIVYAISSTVDLVNNNVTKHHERVAYIASRIASEMKIGSSRMYDLVMAAALHDIGALSEDGESSALHNGIDVNVEEHADIGYLLLKSFSPLSKAADIIRYHHFQWDHGSGYLDGGSIVPFEGHIVHLADYIEMLINKDVHILSQTDLIMKSVKNNSGTLFAPEAVKAFFKAFNNDYGWLQVDHISLKEVIADQCITREYKLTLLELEEFSKIISYIIDFRSPYTASHSSGVAAAAFTLGRLCGFSSNDCILLKIAGYLHDLGKIAIPSSILDKEGKLTSSEFATMRSHCYHTYRILKNINGLETAAGWASCHHERLDGSGYPFGLTSSSLSFGARILAVADVFSALVEHRPYRAGMPIEKATQTIQEMVTSGKLDKAVVNHLINNIGTVYKVIHMSQLRALKEYNRINHKDNLTLNGTVVTDSTSG